MAFNMYFLYQLPVLSDRVCTSFEGKITLAVRHTCIRLRVLIISLTDNFNRYEHEFEPIRHKKLFALDGKNIIVYDFAFRLIFRVQYSDELLRVKIAHFSDATKLTQTLELKHHSKMMSKAFDKITLVFAKRIQRFD